MNNLKMIESYPLFSKPNPIDLACDLYGCIYDACFCFAYLKKRYFRDAPIGRGVVRGDFCANFMEKSGVSGLYKMSLKDPPSKPRKKTTTSSKKMAEALQQQMERRPQQRERERAEEVVTRRLV
jgi:hypothetical protein